MRPVTLWGDRRPAVVTGWRRTDRQLPNDPVGRQAAGHDATAQAGTSLRCRSGRGSGLAQSDDRL